MTLSKETLVGIAKKSFIAKCVQLRRLIKSVEDSVRGNYGALSYRNSYGKYSCIDAEELETMKKPEYLINDLLGEIRELSTEIVHLKIKYHTLCDSDADSYKVELGND